MERNYARKVGLLLYLFFWSFLGVFAQETGKNAGVSPSFEPAFDVPTIKKATQGLEYPNIEKAAPKMQPISDTQNTNDTLFWESLVKKLSGIPVLLKWLLIIGFSLLVCFLIVQYINNDDSDKDILISQADSIEALEQNLMVSDVNPFISRALQDQQYNLAIRLEYLALLKWLTEQKLIQWEPYKTNVHYRNELKGYSKLDLFKKTATTFEYFWYGKKPTQKVTYEAFANEVKQFKAE